MWSAVELREIRVFLTLAEELHFGRTAERLRVTPSSVSQTVRTFEARIGGRLFDRTSRRVRLTPLGQRLLDGTAPAYEALQRSFEGARGMAGGVSGVLRIGTYTPVNGGPHLVDAIKLFRARHPDCLVEMPDSGLCDPVAGLARGDVDLAITRLPLTETGLVIGPVLSAEERVVVVAADHPLAGRASIVYEDLADQVVTDTPRLRPEMMESFVPPYTPSGRRLSRFVPLDFSDVVLRVATGEVVHPTVRPFLEHYSRPGLTAVPIRDLPPSRTALVSRAPREAAPVRAFARVVRDVLGSAGEPWAGDPEWAT